MDHLITNADLAQMLAAKDPKDRIACCSEKSGVQFTISKLDRDAGNGRILIKFHGEDNDDEIEKLEKLVQSLEDDNEELKEDLKKRDEENDSLTDQITELEKQVAELEATHES